jgi:SET domain-containing protein
MADKKDFRVARSAPGKGLGLYARRPFTRGEFLLEYTGKKIPTKEADASKSRYLFEIDEFWTIDGSPRTNIARYINHSCAPNCETDVVDGQIFVFAKRGIKEGEELSFDYGDEYFDEFIKPAGCRCVRCVRKSDATLTTK